MLPLFRSDLQRAPRCTSTGQCSGQSSSSSSKSTHVSAADRQSRLLKKGNFTKAKPCWMSHALAEDRNGLIVDVETSQATGRAEWEAAQLARTQPSVTSVCATTTPTSYHRAKCGRSVAP